jgi:DNA invertase Pin-like site-specific DNA recombinase
MPWLQDWAHLVCARIETVSGYIAYYRVSTARQGASGLGLDAQREAVMRLAKDAPILAEYTEVESGKRHENRPQLLAARASAKKRGAVLLIAKLDRSARSVRRPRFPKSQVSKISRGRSAA